LLRSAETQLQKLKKANGKPFAFFLEQARDRQNGHRKK